MRFKRYFSLWLELFKNNLIRDMEFKNNFISQVIVELAWTAVSLFIYEALFTQANTIGGWGKFQVLFIYAFYRIVSALYYLFFRHNVNRIPYLVNRGEFDFFLTKPVNTLFITTNRIIRPSHLSQLSIGIALTLYATAQLEFSWNTGNFLLFFVLLIAAVAIRLAIGLLLTLPVFWLEKLENIFELQSSFFSLARFPTTAFPTALRLIFSTIIPVLFVAAIPAGIILGKEPLIYLGGVAFVCIFLLLLMHLGFNYALKHYSSASS